MIGKLISAAITQKPNLAVHCLLSTVVLICCSLHKRANSITVLWNTVYSGYQGGKRWKVWTRNVYQTYCSDFNGRRAWIDVNRICCLCLREKISKLEFLGRADLHIIYGLNFVSWIFSKIYKHFWRWKLRLIRIIWHPAKLIESYKHCS